MEKHSNLLKRFASGELDILSALKILKVLLKDMGDEKLIKWVEGEMTGYSTNDTNLPGYRKIRGQVFGNIRTMQSITHQHPLPISGVPQDKVDQLLTVPISFGVEALKKQSQTKDDTILGRPVFPCYYHWFEDGLEACSLTHVYVRYSHTDLINVLSNVENKVLDIFYLLEQQGGDLDEMNVDGINQQGPHTVALINKLVYNSNDITIGNGNKLSKTTLQTESK